MQAALNERQSLRDWEDAPIKDVIQFLAGVQHADLRADLRSIRRMIANLASSHGGWKSDKFEPLQRAVCHLEDEFEAHMEKEESILFPAIRAMNEHAVGDRAFAMPAFGSVRNPIRMMEQEHTQTAHHFVRIRKLTGDYTMRDPDCEMFHMTCQALARLEADVQGHMSLEQVLFRRALQLEGRLSRK